MAKPGHRSSLASLRFRVNAATKRRKHRSTFCGLRGAFEQLTGNVWMPAYSRPCYRQKDAGVEHALLEQLTLFPNASIVLEDVDSARHTQVELSSPHKSADKTQTIARKRWHGVRKRKCWNVRSTCGQTNHSGMHVGMDIHCRLNKF